MVTTIFNYCKTKAASQVMTKRNQEHNQKIAQHAKHKKHKKDETNNLIQYIDIKLKIKK